MTVAFDVAIVGAGIAGASLAWHLAPLARVVLLERESQPGYHSTGRSAAMFMESYGPPQARALTRASRAFYAAPPAGFADSPVLGPRGVLYAAWQGQAADLSALHDELAATGVALQRLNADEALARVPVLRPEGLLGALAEPDAMDIDVAALHQGFLRGSARQGAALRCGAELVGARREGTAWQLQLADGARLRCTVLVNAAGAWADRVGALAGAPAVGLQPRRRSAFAFAAPEGMDHRRWPAVVSADETWYVKPDAGQWLGSPANADPVAPQDVQPEILDIATGIAAIEAHTRLVVGRPRRTWAGLRSFVADGELVIGFDPACAGLFWLAGQGGYGIQSAAAAAALAASLLQQMALPAALVEAGVEPSRMAPRRAMAAAG